MRYLFERLSEPVAASTDAFDVLAAVQAQLCRILVGHPGTLGEGEPHLLNFGLPGVVDIHLSGTDQVDGLIARVRQLITHYEPRLSDVQVAVEATTEWLSPYRIIVQARLTGDGEGRTLRFPLEPSLH